MTITLSIPAVWGLIFAAIIPYAWGVISAEEGGGINPLVSLLVVAVMQFFMFSFIYGLMTLLSV